ncbi:MULTISPECIES: hypothetical protein [Actinoalloteichus]|uniref:Uncharacterized protein n=1 Tax=Actinoalloteichus fjordicus TaxID=1612552 RepID=A0AAC9LH14_9PSEU|nr:MULTISPECIES: hypothetical protein [Actinoalloteichus]APU16725.1 hypothetical protein UA74_23535 [Actinoalloteichus fjordicus]APU22791.1 hypothetical protein UA75_24045 [Actinoalloteichus sp. GBA129-24]
MADRHSQARSRSADELRQDADRLSGERAYCVAERLGLCPSQVLQVLHDLGYRGSAASTVLEPRVVNEVESVLIATRD